MPRPSSRTESTRSSPRLLKRTCSTPPSGMASRPLRARFQKTCLIWSGSARHTCGPPAASNSTLWPSRTSGPLRSSGTASSTARPMSIGPLGGRGDRDAEVEGGPVGTPVDDLEPREALVAGPGLQGQGLEQRRGEQLPEGTLPDVGRAHAQDRLAEVVHVEDVAARVGGDEAAVDAVDDDLVELLEVGHLLGGFLELLPYVAEALREVGADQGHRRAGHPRHENRIEKV